MIDFDRNIIIAYADNGMSASRAGKALNYQPNSISYHLTQIKKRTGLDPRNFHDLCILYAMATEERKDK